MYVVHGLLEGVKDIKDGFLPSPLLTAGLIYLKKLTTILELQCSQHTMVHWVSLLPQGHKKIQLSIL